MNWGKWIIASFILFAGFIVTLVTICMRQDISLVSKDYYQEELAYQEQITRISNTSALMEKPLISVLDNDRIEVTLRHPIERGKLTLFCPSDPEMDRTFQLDSDHKQLINIHAVKNGMYRAKMYWSANGKDYFFEEIINI